MHFGHDKQDRTVTAAMALAARLLPPMARTQRLGLIRMIRACRFLALGAVETLGQVADRRPHRSHFGRQGRFAPYRPRVLRPPVVRFPLELDIVLLRQHHRLLGKRRRALIIDRCKRSGGDALWLSAFHGLGYSSFFWKVPFFLMATMGCPNIYLRHLTTHWGVRCNSLALHVSPKEKLMNIIRMTLLDPAAPPAVWVEQRPQSIC